MLKTAIRSSDKSSYSRSISHITPDDNRTQDLARICTSNTLHTMEYLNSNFQNYRLLPNFINFTENDNKTDVLLRTHIPTKRQEIMKDKNYYAPCPPYINKKNGKLLSPTTPAINLKQLTLQHTNKIQRSKQQTN